jgi:hypothetical protein
MLQFASVSGAASKSPEIAATPSLGERLQGFAVAQLHKARAQLSRQGDARHEGIHEARKCLRKARATLALASSALSRAAMPLDRELQRLCRGLSTLRDGQALIEALHRLDGGARADAVSASRALEAAMHRRNEMLARALVRDTDFQARRRRLERVEARLGRLDWASLRHADVQHAMLRSEQRVQKAGQRAQRRRNDNQAWHTFRRRLRRFRQQIALLEEIEPALAGPSHGLDHQASALGASQDDALLLARCGRRSPFPIDVRRELRCIARQRVKQARSIPTSGQRPPKPGSP